MQTNEKRSYTDAHRECTIRAAKKTQEIKREKKKQVRNACLQSCFCASVARGGINLKQNLYISQDTVKRKNGKRANSH